MPYQKQTWRDLPNETTPLSAARLNHLETQFDEATVTSKSYTDSEIARVEGLIPDGPSESAWRGLEFPFAQDINRAFGPVGEKLTVPTHVTPSGGEGTHPSVVFFPEGWNGFRYWMAFTPYPGGSDAHEDPNIVASQDGVSWVVPPGLTNPLDDAPGTPRFNSDTELVFAEGKLWCFWRYLDQNAGSTSLRFYVRTSVDGVNWTPKEVVYQANASTTNLLSPTLIYKDGRWTMWCVQVASPTNKLVRFQSTGSSPLLGQWGASQVCQVSVPANRDPWHIEIKEVGGDLYGILNDCDRANSGLNGDLYLIKSMDGVNWLRGKYPAIPRTQSGEHASLYRSSFVAGVKDGVFGFHVWYSGWRTGPQVWNLYKSFIGSDTGWVNLEMQDGWDAVVAQRPMIRSQNGVLSCRGVALRKTGGFLNSIAKIPESFPIQGGVTVLSGAHVAVRGSNKAMVEVIPNMVSRVVSVDTYNTLDSSVDWLVPIGFTALWDQPTTG